jgi:magnesium transporter
MIRSLVVDEEGVSSVEDPAAAIAAAGTTWVDVLIEDGAGLASVSETFDLHQLSIEDVGNEVRPKTERFDTHTFVLVKAGRLRRGDTTFEEELDETPVGLFIGPDWLVTVRYEAVGAVDRPWDAVSGGERRYLGRGPDFLAYRVIDGVVDGYFDLLEEVEARIELIEEEVIDDPGEETLAEINAARRELLSIRKLVWPTREAVGILARGDPEQISAETEKYFRDIYDHLVQQGDLVETYRDLATGARDIYLNVLSMSTNEVMKRLTVVATIVLPMTVVVGVYGMNFAEMPELDWTYGYPAVLLGMLGMAGVMVWYFRRTEWL